MVIDDKIIVIDAGLLHQVMSGNIPGHIYKKIRAHSHAVGTADQEISALNVVGFGNWPSTGGVVSVVSDNAADAAAGTGARSIIVRGLLKTTWAEDTETVVPNGVNPVTTTKEFIRINELEVVTSGLVGTTIKSNVGTITASIGADDIIEIYPQHSTSDAGRITIPAGYEGHFQNPEASAIGNKAMTYHIFCRDNTVTDAAFQLRGSWSSLDGGYRPNGLIEIFTEKVDLIFIGHAELAGAKANASIEGYIKEVT